MESIKGTESFFMIILSLLSKIIDIPNYPELVSESKAAREEGRDDSSLVKKNVFSDINTVAKQLFQRSSEFSENSDQAIFGKPLPVIIPTKLIRLISFLKSHIHLEGIYRINGSKKRINDLKRLLDTHGNVVDWEKQEHYTVHDAANVLKMYLSELPAPLLGDKHIDMHLAISKLENPEKKLEAVQLTCFLIPEHNRLFLNMILVLLADTARNPSNLMSSYNLGLIFAPHILKSQQIDKATGMCLGNTTISEELEDMVTYTAYLIDSAERIFECPPDLKAAASRYKSRLDNGEHPSEIPIEIGSSCQQITTEEAVRCVQDETKTALMGLYEEMQELPEGKDKDKKIKKFHKHYPQLIMEMNHCSHSPMVRTKSVRRIGSSFSKILSGSRFHSPALSNTSVSRLNLAGVTPAGIASSTFLNVTNSPSVFQAAVTPATLQSNPLKKYPTIDTSTPVTDMMSSTPAKSMANHKRKVLEMLGNSPSSIPPMKTEIGEDVNMDSDEHKPVRRKLNPETDLKDDSETESKTDDGSISMEYREIGETYREYFV